MTRSALLLASLLTTLPLSPFALGQRVNCTNGEVQLPSTSYPCDAVDLLAHVPLSALDATEETLNAAGATDLWGWTDPDTGREYALIGIYEGTSFIDVTDPEAPLLLGTLPTHTQDQGGQRWRDVKTYEHYAFVVSEAEGHGMQVFDLTQLRNVESPPVTFSETAYYGGFGSAHNVNVSEAAGYAYVVGSNTCSGGLHIINVQDPTGPVFAGCFGELGYIHDAQCLVYDGPDTDHVGREICLVAHGPLSPSQQDLFAVVDVTNKDAPEILGEMIYPAPQGDVSDLYAHQGWLTDDGRYFLAGDEFDETDLGINTRTLVFDVQDLDAPTFIDAHYSQQPSIDHNQYVRGGYTFQSNYTSGLRVLELGDLSQAEMTEVAYFDTYPAGDQKIYAGSWSNYPFFESGIVIVSDIQGGLFVLQPRLDPALAEEPDALPDGFALTAAYPNPFSARTQFELTLGNAQHVDVTVFDVLGRRVADLFHGALGAGEQRTFVFDGSDLPAGLYFFRVTGEDFAETRQVSLTR